MKYAIAKVVNGNFSIHAEGFTNIDSAKVNYHGLCQALWNDEDTVSARVGIVDENLDFIPNYKEFISHAQE